MSSANVFAQVLRRASVGLHRLGALEAAPGSSRSSSGSRLGTCSPHFGCSTRAYSDGGRRSVSHGSQGLELPGRDLVDQDPLWEAVAQELAALSVERRVLEARLQEMSLESSSSETMPVAVESAAGVSLLWNEAPAPAEELTPKRPEPPVAYEPLAALAGAGQRQIIIICDYESHPPFHPNGNDAEVVQEKLRELTAQYGDLADIRVYGETDFSSAVHQAGFSLIHCPQGDRKHFIEHRIGRDLRNLERFTTNPALVTIGFITSDSDFIPHLHSLASHGFRTLLFSSVSPDSPLAAAPTEPLIGLDSVVSKNVSRLWAFSLLPTSKRGKKSQGIADRKAAKAAKKLVKLAAAKKLDLKPVQKVLPEPSKQKFVVLKPMRKALKDSAGMPVAKKWASKRLQRAISEKAIPTPVPRHASSPMDDVWAEVHAL